MTREKKAPRETDGSVTCGCFDCPHETPFGWRHCGDAANDCTRSPN